MQQFIEFMGNHPFLFAALAAVIVWMIVSEIKRKTVGAKALNPKEAILLINHEDAQLLDVRETTEYKKGHVINAKNAPLSAIADSISSLKLDKQKPLIAYCAAGNKAPYAAAQLKKQGFERLYYLKRGIYGWLNENLPVEK